MSSGSFSGPLPGANVYNGPTRMPVAIRAPTSVYQLTRFVDVTTVAATTFGFAVSNIDPQNLPIAEYTALIALWREYRVLSIEVEYVPGLQGAVQAGQVGSLPWFTVVDRDFTTPPASYAALIENSSLRICGANEKFLRQAKMNSPLEAEFVGSASAPGGVFSILGFVTLTTAASTLGFGKLIARYMVEFRTRI